MFYMRVKFSTRKPHIFRANIQKLIFAFFSFSPNGVFFDSSCFTFSGISQLLRQRMAVKHLQKCYMSPSKPPRMLPSASSPLNNEGYEKGSFLIYQGKLFCLTFLILYFIGKDTGYSYAAVGDRLSVFQSNGYMENSTLDFTISFGPDTSVVDCIYFPLSGIFSYNCTLNVTVGF